MQVVVVEMSSPPLLMVEYPKVPGFENSDPQHHYSSCHSASKLPIKDPIDGSARLEVWVSLLSLWLEPSTDGPLPSLPRAEISQFQK